MVLETLFILMCPTCRGELTLGDLSVTCGSCGEVYRFVNGHASQLDLRPHAPQTVELRIEVGDRTTLSQANAFCAGELAMHDSPEVSFDDEPVPSHMSRELMSYFPRAKDESSYVLDLGCGNQPHRHICEHAGFKYIPLDHSDSSAPILGDAHALPFKDGSIDFVLSIAVLEHLQFPWIAMREIGRVLKPGGKLIGTVAFSEPFHGNSFYHHTHLGIFSLLTGSGLLPERIAPDRGWSAPRAHAVMGAYWYPARVALRIAAALQEMEFQIRRFSSRDIHFWQMRCHTGAFTFIAHKPNGYHEAAVACGL